MYSTWSAARQTNKADQQISAFNPCALYGVRQQGISTKRGFSTFNPRTPHGVRTVWINRSDEDVTFNPRARMECDNKISDCLQQLPYFQSTHSHGARLVFLQRLLCCIFFQSTYSAWSTTVNLRLLSYQRNLSIHVLRMEHDCPNIFALRIKLLQAL